MAGIPDIRDYQDYRKFLGDRARMLKSGNRRFSHRFIASAAGAHSAGWFADILAGRQKLKPRHVDPLATAFKLDAAEKAVLSLLVELEGAETPEQRAAAHAKWLELKGVPEEKIARDRFKYFERWYYPALREFLSLRKFAGDYQALAAKLYPSIRSKQAKEAVAVLKRLGLFLPGSPDPIPVLVKDASTRTTHWKKLQKAFMGLALTALDRFGKDERDFSALTLAFSPEGLKRAGEEISALRKRLLLLSERDRGRNRVYQCLFQVFPVSYPVEVKRAQDA